MKNRQEVSLVYCTNQTKRLMKKLRKKEKKKTIEQSGVRKGSPMKGGREGFKEKVSFEFRVEKSRSNGQ